MAADFTQRLLIEAGINPGMRVLDVGCGSGDVSFLLAQLVGEEGQVVGVDRDARPLALARERAATLGLSNLRFVEGGFDAFAAEPATFDAAVGRRVLMYQPEPIVPLSHLLNALRPGGVVVFQEHDSAMVLCLPASLPLHQQVRGWIWETVECEGANVHMGLALETALTGAGFAVECVRAEAVLISPAMQHPIASIVLAMLPRIITHGVVGEEEIDIETLGERLTEERTNANTTFVWELIFGAWGQKPDQSQ